MKNTHQRLLNHPIEAVRPWIALAWSGTADDIFPRDRIPNWRKNPEGIAPLALVPNVTRLGHGPFAFTLTQWDGNTWRVALEKGLGFHGFELESVGDKTRIVHTLDANLDTTFRLFVEPIHDWAVESMFDRLEAALAEGVVPAHTGRPMGLFTHSVWSAMRTVRTFQKRRALRSRKSTAALDTQRSA